MPDAVFEGFGANTPVPLTTATVDILCRYIAAPPDGFARIRAINFGVAQTGGAFVAATVLPVFILRGAANMGVSAAAGGSLVIPLRPTGLVLPGLPDVGQIVGGLELLFAAYYRVTQSGVGFVFPVDEESDSDLVARHTQKLAVCVGPLVDVTTANPVLAAAGVAGVTVSVLGSSGRINTRTENPGTFGKTSSLPRFDIDASKHGEDVDNF